MQLIRRVNKLVFLHADGSCSEIVGFVEEFITGMGCYESVKAEGGLSGMEKLVRSLKPDCDVGMVIMPGDEPADTGLTTIQKIKQTTGAPLAVVVPKAWQEAMCDDFSPGRFQIITEEDAREAGKLVMYCVLAKICRAKLPCP